MRGFTVAEGDPFLAMDVEMNHAGHQFVLYTQFGCKSRPVTLGAAAAEAVEIRVVEFRGTMAPAAVSGGQRRDAVRRPPGLSPLIRTCSPGAARAS